MDDFAIAVIANPPRARQTAGKPGRNRARSKHTVGTARRAR